MDRGLEARRKFERTGEVDYLPIIEPERKDVGLPSAYIWSWYRKWIGTSVAMGSRARWVRHVAPHRHRLSLDASNHKRLSPSGHDASKNAAFAIEERCRSCARSTFLSARSRAEASERSPKATEPKNPKVRAHAKSLDRSDVFDPP